MEGASSRSRPYAEELDGSVKTHSLFVVVIMAMMVDSPPPPGCLLLQRDPHSGSESLPWER